MWVFTRTVQLLGSGVDLTGAVHMDRGWSSLHICIIRHDPEAMAGTLGRDDRLYGAISARDLEPILEELGRRIAA